MALRLNFFLYSPKLSTIFFLLKNVYMPTIVGILTFKNKTYAYLSLEKELNFCQILVLMTIKYYMLSLVEHKIILPWGMILSLNYERFVFKGLSCDRSFDGLMTKQHVNGLSLNKELNN